MSRYDTYPVSEHIQELTTRVGKHSRSRCVFEAVRVQDHATTNQTATSDQMASDQTTQQIAPSTKYVEIQRFDNSLELEELTKEEREGQVRTLSTLDVLD